MLLSSQADFNYEDQTSSSNPPGPSPAGDGGSGRGDRYRDPLNTTLGFGGSRGSASGSNRADDQNSNPAGPPPARESGSGRGDRYRDPLNTTLGFGGSHGSASGSSRADFNDQTSNPAEHPPAGDGSFGRGFFSGNFGFGGVLSSSASGSRGSSGNDDNERRNPNSRLPATRRRNERSQPHLSRDDLRDVAFGTLQTLDEGEYFPPGAVEPYDLKVKIHWTEDNTRYYGPDAGEGGEMFESEFVSINEEGGDEGKNEEVEKKDSDVQMGVGEESKKASSLDGTKQSENESERAVTRALEADNSSPKAKAKAETPVPPSSTSDTQVCIGEYSTLVGARKVHLGLSSNLGPPANKKIGVLNFASAKKPGGGFINGSQAQEESIARASTLYASLSTTAASQFYKHYREDPSNAYYTHAMVYSPGVLLLRDDNGEWRSPVEVDVLTSAAVNAGEIRRGLEREERLRREREEKDIWRKKGEERRREREKAMAEKEKVMAERERVRKEREILARENEKLKEKAEVAKLKKKTAELTKSQKGIAKSGDRNETKETGKGKELGKGKETEKGKETDSGSEGGETPVEYEKADEEKEKSEENQQGNASHSPESGRSADAEVKRVEENTESKGASIQYDRPQPRAPPEVNQESKKALIQYDQPQPWAPPEVNQEPTSSTTIPHPLAPQTRPSQVPKPDPDLRYALAFQNTESQIRDTMSARISRILHLFQLHQTSHLILGSFGTGVFQNRISLVASIFADLLVKPGGRFKNVFDRVVFAILGKETVRIFADVFSKVERGALRGTGGSCVFLDEDGDVWEGEGEEERMMRMMRWEARRTALADAAQAEADAASFAAAQTDAAAQAEADAAVQADAAAYTAQSDPTAAAGDDRIADNDKMILTEDDERVDLAVEGSASTATASKAMIIEDGRDVEMVEIKSLSAGYREAQNSTLNEKEDGDVEMQ